MHHCARTMCRCTRDLPYQQRILVCRTTAGERAELRAVLRHQAARLAAAAAARRMGEEPAEPEEPATPEAVTLRQAADAAVMQLALRALALCYKVCCVLPTLRMWPAERQALQEVADRQGPDFGLASPDMAHPGGRYGKKLPPDP